MYILEGPEWTDHLDQDKHWNPRCTVTTRRNTQCRHRLFGGQVDTPFNGTHYISDEQAAVFHAGACAFHRYVQERK